MGRYAQLIIGPAGCGKSTYSRMVQEHCETLGRAAHVVNLDPAAEHFGYQVAFDIRDLVTLEDVMEELKLGPNGALVGCMEYLEENLDEWLGEELEGYGDEDYLVFDCPGQIELYSHLTVFRSLSDWLKNQGWAVCAVYCLDCQFISDATKFVAGSLQALAAMMLLELPHFNVLTKVDMLTQDSKELLEQHLVPDARRMVAELETCTGPEFRKLNQAVSGLLDDWAMVNFAPLDYSDEDSIGYVLSQIDYAIQFGEEADVRIRDGEEMEPDGDDSDNGGNGLRGL